MPISVTIPRCSELSFNDEATGACQGRLQKVGSMFQVTASRSSRAIAALSGVFASALFVADDWPADGHYTFRDVASGSYIVQAWGGEDESVTYYGGGSSPKSATPIVVTRGRSVRNIDITRAPTATLTGTISAIDVDTAGTRAVLVSENVEVLTSAYVYQDAYSLSAVKAGRYLVKFVPPAGRLIGGWWKDSSSRVTATPVTLEAGVTTELGDAQLAVHAPGSISGHVTGGVGTEVGIEGPGLDPGVPQSALVNEHGNYEFTDLAPGKFQLSFANGQHLDGTFGDRKSDSVVVRAGKTTTAASVTIKKLIPVRVSATGSGKPLSVYATIYDLDGVRITDGYVGDEGESEPIMVPRGRYKVLFSPSGDDPTRGLVWLGNKPTFSSSAKLDLRTKKSATISAKLPSVSTFTAKAVDDAKKRPLSDINVKVWERQPNGHYRDLDFRAATDSSGKFTVESLGAGTYKFQLVDLTYHAYRTTWFGGTSLSSARAVKIGLAPSRLSSSTTTKLKPTTGTVGVATPIISGTVAVGSKLTAKTPLVWPSAGVKKTYRWLRDGANIAGATSSAYRLTSADAGKEITVRITGSKTSYSTSSAVSLPKNTLG